MNIKELTALLTDSSESFQNHKFIPWWTDDYENYIYPYDIFEREMISEAEACLEKCDTEALLAPTGCFGLTLFHLLVIHNFYEPVKKMLCDGRITAENVDLADHRGHGLTPFLLACSRGNLAMVRLLLDHGADASLWDERGMNAYHFLAYPRYSAPEHADNGPDLALNFESLERSVEQKGEIARLLTCDINKKENNGLTPLELLLSKEYSASYTWPLTEIFLEKGAKTDYVDEAGNTLLMMAIRHGHKTATLRLIEHCPELINTANKKGVTPLLHSIDFRNQPLYLALLDHGATPVPDNEMELFPLSQITGNAFAGVQETDRDALAMALYMTEKLIGQLDPDDDEIGEITYILHNALISDSNAHVLDCCQNAGIDFTMPIYYHGESLCLRDECLRPAFGINTLKKLVELGVDMNKAVTNGQTPAIILASMEQSSDESYFEEAAKLFSRESMEQTDNQGETAIHLAAENGHTTMLKVMLEKGVNVNLTEDAPAEAGTSPLHLACANGHVDVVKLLMDAGADDTVKTINGETPAHLALSRKRYGKEFNITQRKEILSLLKNLDIPREDGKTPFLLLDYTTGELLSLFLERGVNVNHADNTGMTALMSADKDMIKLLLRAGADLTMADNAGNTALHHALSRGSEEDARFLIRKGADYNRPNNHGETPVQIAVENGLDTVLELMTDIR
ncbi:ankyrin repeat domain-containing protein [Acetatifactor muris]|uniref:Phosphocholine transferase AnkX n=1 Tax=Acetatifactor muris TaxID=879566 RepID=A0A2K4ZJD9_9FIRM|nr:ankyrin repeat domain-containing protein [Acetatifactor muris]MCR2048833.1 ankyrin repeat domain-containing protein [Acetatifactor muris]SOY30581.1 Phosphocholine transferase AnkX [Acetatifactor muris]